LRRDDPPARDRAASDSLRSPSAVLLSLFVAGLIVSSDAPLVRAGHRGANPVAAPAFSLPTSRGTASLDSLRGQVVWVDFWASWCGPCRKSFPWMKTMAERYGPRGFSVVAISLDKSRDDADAFLADFPAPFTVAYDPSGTTAEAYKVKAMPSSYLIDRGGRITYSHAGFDIRATAAAETVIAQACR
jgi:thiol-disulfide isomerase/thioredoxin